MAVTLWQQFEYYYYYYYVFIAIHTSHSKPPPVSSNLFCSFIARKKAYYHMLTKAVRPTHAQICCMKKMSKVPVNPFWSENCDKFDFIYSTKNITRDAHVKGVSSMNPDCALHKCGCSQCALNPA